VHDLDACRIHVGFDLAGRQGECRHGRWDLITNTATVSSATADPDSTNNTAAATTSVGVAADLCSMARAITGTNESDTLNGTAGDDAICGGHGRDTINGRGGTT
jgi:Ca2+-binding RTX toxin-like protein